MLYVTELIYVRTYIFTYITCTYMNVYARRYICINIRLFVWLTVWVWYAITVTLFFFFVFFFEMIKWLWEHFWLYIWINKFSLNLCKCFFFPSDILFRFNFLSVFLVIIFFFPLFVFFFKLHRYLQKFSFLFIFFLRFLILNNYFFPFWFLYRGHWGFFSRFKKKNSFLTLAVSNFNEDLQQNN